MSCYDAVRGEGYLWTSGWDRGGSVSVWLSPSLSRFYLLVFLRGDVLSVTFLSSGSWPKIWKKAVLLELITSTFLTILCLCCRFNPDSFLLRQYNMCLVLADSHVYKAHICVHMCNTRYSSNLLLWLLLMMILVPFSKFQPVFFFLSWFPVDELCCRSLKREEGDSCDSSHSVSFQGFVDILMKPFFYYSHCNVVTLILIICFFVVFFFKWACC